jgi:phosphoribosylformylglycinamidine (FGAM) synthase-like amidotransferase family enzyme
MNYKDQVDKSIKVQYDNVVKNISKLTVCNDNKFLIGICGQMQYLVEHALSVKCATRRMNKLIKYWDKYKMMTLS